MPNEPWTSIGLRVRTYDRFTEAKPEDLSAGKFIQRLLDEYEGNDE